MNSLQYLLFTLTFLMMPFFQTLHGQKQSQPVSRYEMCANNFTCGNSSISGIGYPFRGSNSPPFCGLPGLALVCDSQTNVTTIDIMSTKYRVLQIDQSTRTLRISREDVMDARSSCPREKTNTTLDYSIFNYGPGYTNITFFFGCPNRNNTNYVPCAGNDTGAYVLAGVYGPGKCEASVVVPVKAVTRTGLGQVLREGFWVSWKTGDEAFCNECVGSKGRCGYDSLVNRTVCYCSDMPYNSHNDCCIAGEASEEKYTPSRTGTFRGF